MTANVLLSTINRNLVETVQIQIDPIEVFQRNPSTMLYCIKSFIVLSCPVQRPCRAGLAPCNPNSVSGILPGPARTASWSSGRPGTHLPALAGRPLGPATGSGGRGGLQPRMHASGTSIGSQAAISVREHEACMHSAGDRALRREHMPRRVRGGGELEPRAQRSKNNAEVAALVGWLGWPGWWPWL